MIRTFAEFTTRLDRFIRANMPLSGNEIRTPAQDHDFGELALSLFALQYGSVPAYRNFCDIRHVTPGSVADWKQIPPVPARAFKEFDLTSLSAAERTHAFHSSGTTGQKPGRQFHDAASLACYEQSLVPWFRAHLLPDEPPEIGLVVLTPSPADAPHSSLVHMAETIRRSFNWRFSEFVAGVDADNAWVLHSEVGVETLRGAQGSGLPVLILGTAFSFVHLLDHLAAGDRDVRLPDGSRVMETGGYKGRSRMMPKDELHELIARRLGVPPSHIVCEYGMSELSSQAYDRAAGHRAPRFNASTLQRPFRFPPWARARIVSPETGMLVGEGETGLIQVFDLANARSVMAIQTEDLAVLRADGFELMGRAQLAEPRGCSLMTAAPR
ncbi:MAG TPA: hypothetical protein VJW76_05100 [Verrucomicrobiae bacterium]|nr:hypothetical protein [Verrucomicrobiae bacterium]